MSRYKVTPLTVNTFPRLQVHWHREVATLDDNVRIPLLIAIAVLQSESGRSILYSIIQHLG